MTKESNATSPILNGPYDEPLWHYATTTDGSLDYEDRRKGRRIFAPDTPQVPLGRPPQAGMFDLNDFAARYREELVNVLREQVGNWRRNGYEGVTSRVTVDLLRFWFDNPERPSHQQLFFAQQEAVETAIWLNEVATKSNPGTHALNLLSLAQDTAAGADETGFGSLPRIAFKMATGTGKTVVMACLILYHYLNRQQYRNDPKYADYFLLVAPGITIRDRLGVLRYDGNALADHDALDYYRQRKLIPPAYAGVKQLKALNDRAELEIRFPNLVGYKIEHDHDEVRADFTGTPGFTLDLHRIPAETSLGTAFSAAREQLRTDPDALRDQEVVYWVAAQVLSRYYRGEDGRVLLEKFGDIRRIVQIWYDTKVELLGETDPRFKRLVRHEDPRRVANSVYLGVQAAAVGEALRGSTRIVPLLNRYNPSGSTTYVHASTAKPVFPTRKSHVNLVVADTDGWEQIAAKTLEQLPQVESYVKNAFLGFEVPYVDKAGAERRCLMAHAGLYPPRNLLKQPRNSAGFSPMTT